MPRTVGNVSVYMGPHTLNAPDNLEEAIVSFIDQAKNNLDVAVQELESRRIAEALIQAKGRRVKVRVVLEGDYLAAETRRPDPFQPGGAHEPNRELFAALLRAKIDVRTDYNPEIFHQKFIMRDIDKGKTALLTGSTNFTPTGTHQNLNHLVVVHGKRLAKKYAEEFEEIWGGTFGTAGLRHDPKPSELTVSGVRVKALFAPDHSPEMEIMKQMLKAKRRVDFAIFTFAQSSGIDDTMIALQRAGVAVRGIVDSGQGNREWAATRPVRNAGGELYLARRGEGLNKLHHKLMVIDGQLIIAGSFNYTAPANRLNDENILILGKLDEVKQDSIQKQKKLGAYALAEIDRMILQHGQPA
ncbi:MAG: phosphatidylserine/phosphatidylglycerophosphate/cardiolipin synthase family protein [Nitrospinota bacterium]